MVYVSWTIDLLWAVIKFVLMFCTIGIVIFIIVVLVFDFSGIITEVNHLLVKVKMVTDGLFDHQHHSPEESSPGNCLPFGAYWSLPRCLYDSWSSKRSHTCSVRNRHWMTQLSLGMQGSLVCFVWGDTPLIIIFLFHACASDVSMGWSAVERYWHSLSSKHCWAPNSMSGSVVVSGDWLFGMGYGFRIFYDTPDI